MQKESLLQVIFELLFKYDYSNMTIGKIMKSHIPKIPAGEFKAKCLHLLDEVSQEHIPLIITKRGKPVAKLVPIEDEKPQQIFGYLSGSARIVGDIISSTGEKWEADE